MSAQRGLPENAAAARPVILLISYLLDHGARWRLALNTFGA